MVRNRSRKPGARYADHPLVKYVRSMDQGYYLTREVAELLDCTITTLTQLSRRAGAPLGPTHQASYGGIVLHLYTQERVDEIARFLEQTPRAINGGVQRGPVALWTRTERLARQRAQTRARNYRVRAERYREIGQSKEAERMEKMNAALLAKLEKTRISRWEKVHGVPFGATK